MARFKITSCKGSETIDGTAADAVMRAVAHSLRLMPAGGADVQDSDGAVVATTRLGGDVQQRGGVVVEFDDAEVDVSGMEEREARAAIREALDAAQS